MSLREELISKVEDIFKYQWRKRDGRKVPEPDDLQLTNDAVILDGTVLYADLSGSTKLVDGYRDYFAAEIYKVFLYCAARIIRNEGGIITAYDGDRIMAVYLGNTKNTDAAKAALKINYARLEIINPAIKAQYPNARYQVKHVVGIDTSQLYVSRTGIKGFNDLVWVGRAANHAAKLTTLSPEYPSRITREVFIKLMESSKYSAPPKTELMWESVKWTTMNRSIYRSNYYWPV